ncbi:MAG: Na+/H+ antiporter subunit D [Verrucomicrobiae bacterium]|nr:Na+/H+ antiporter subunit D [Verrucomicrobiae bacterium]NNJ86005.1 Na+/H+ antiporter subunit D [Akkermansiaceae bacterium]
MTPENTLLLCLLAPFIGALGCLLVRTNLKLAGVIAIASSAVSLAAALALVQQTSDGSVFAMHAGNWPAPYGIVLVADGFSALMLAVCQLVVLGCLIYGSKALPVRLKRRHLYPLILTLGFGTNGAFLTGDLFNLYVWFEVLLLSSFSLMAALGGTENRRATWRYVVINLISSLLFLVAAGLVYGKTGTLNFADLRLLISNTESPFLINSSAALLLGAFGIKAALIPLAFWLPASYPQLPPALAALFAGLLTKVGLYALFRVFAMVLSVGESFPHKEILYGLAVLTMVGGVLGAVGQGDMRRILSFHIISQVGYMALALALFTPLALAAGIFYLVHHIVVKANLFLVTGLVEKHAGSSKIGHTSGVLHSSPVIALAFAIPALSLAGIPPLSGFFAKFTLLRAALEAKDSLAAIAIVLVGLLTIFSMLKIWRSIFWGEAKSEQPVTGKTTLTPLNTILALAAITIAIGLGCGPIFQLAHTAAEGLVDPSAYIEAVLGSGNPEAP